MKYKIPGRAVMYTTVTLMISGCMLSPATSATLNNLHTPNAVQTPPAASVQPVPLNEPLIISSFKGKFMTTDVNGALSQEAFSPQRYNIWTIKRGYANNRYLITTLINNNRYCLQGSSEASKISVDKCDKEYLFWQIIPRNNGTFLIMQDYQGRYLTSPWTSVAGKVSFTDEISKAQEWKITKYTHHNIESVSNGMLISADTVRLDITQHPRSAKHLQKWHLQLGDKEGVYRIQTINGGDEMCLRGEGWDLVDGQLQSNDHVTASPGCYGPNLYWRLLPADKGTFYIRNEFKNLNLTASDKGSGGKLILSPPTTNPDQKWKMPELD